MSLGRPPEDGKTREHVMCIRLNDDDLTGIEATRGKRKKAVFARDAIREKIARERGK